MSKECVIEGCVKPSVSRAGWCYMHYTRWRRHGNPGICLLTWADQCKYPGCTSSFKMNNGYCNKHMLRIRRYGDPSITHNNRGVGDTPEERFWSRVDKSPGFGRDGDCWQWLSGKNDWYGKITVDGWQTLTHIYSWYLANGRKPQLGMQILHSCDNKRCVNPEHLREGTLQENLQEAIDRGFTAWGEKNASAKLTIEDVKTIKRTLRDNPTVIRKHLARQYGVSPSVISDISVGRTWSRVSIAEDSTCQ